MNDSLFAAAFPNRRHYTTGPANGDYPLIRLCSAEQLTGVDPDIPDPAEPTVGGFPVFEPVWGGPVG